MFINSPPAEPHRTAELLFPYQAVSLGNDFGHPVFNSVGLAGLKSTVNISLFALLLAPFLCRTVFPFSSFTLWVGIVKLGSSD